MEFIDQPTQIRAGEELDQAKLTAYLSEHLPGFSKITGIKQFPSGYSNLTYFISTPERELVLRRPPFGANIKSAHDMGREYKVLSLLKTPYGKVPEPLVHCESEEVLGAPFYVMERVKGLIFRNMPPKGLDLTPELMRSISEATVDNLAALHNLDLEKHGLLSFGKPEGYVQRQVEGWTRRYYKAETDTIAAMNTMAEWMPKNMPPDGKPAFIHNDYKYDNLVLDPTQPNNILAVLDWEMATVGDPLMDLGTSLGYWATKEDPEMLQNFSLTRLPGNLNRKEIVERYAEKTGSDVSNILFYYVYACFKIGVIAQQIYARFKLGYSKDPRFGMLIHLVKACAGNGVKALESGSI